MTRRGAFVAYQGSDAEHDYLVLWTRLWMQIGECALVCATRVV